jgi:hypothetical protein
VRGWSHATTSQVHHWVLSGGAPGGRCKRAVTAKRLCLNRNLIDLIGGMTGALVNAPYGLGAGRLRQAEHHAGLGVGPGVLEVDVLLALDGEIGLMCLQESWACKLRFSRAGRSEGWRKDVDVGSGAGARRLTARGAHDPASRCRGVAGQITGLVRDQCVEQVGSSEDPDRLIKDVQLLERLRQHQFRGQEWDR